MTRDLTKDGTRGTDTEEFRDSRGPVLGQDL